MEFESLIETKTKSLSDRLFNETKVYDERAMSQEEVKALDIMKGSGRRLSTDILIFRYLGVIIHRTYLPTKSSPKIV